MAMNGNTLGDEIKDAIVALDPPFKDEIDTDFCRALANAIVNHIQSNAIASGADSGGDTHALTIA